jgi:hypothetical protein
MSEKWTVEKIDKWIKEDAHVEGETCPDDTCDMIRFLRAELALAKKATAREILEILTIVDENNADYEDTWQQSFTAIRAKYGVE